MSGARTDRDDVTLRKMIRSEARTARKAATAVHADTAVVLHLLLRSIMVFRLELELSVHLSLDDYLLGSKR